MKHFEEEYKNGIELCKETINLMERLRSKRRATSFDEISLEDRITRVEPREVKVSSWITREWELKGGGIISAAMDTVTEKEMCLAMAKMGGLGVLHRNMSEEEQSEQLEWVRTRMNNGGMLEKPVKFKPTDRYSKLQKEVEKNGWTFTSFPVVDENEKLVGLITKDSLSFVEDDANPQLHEIMMKRENVVTTDIRTDSKKAYELMKQHRVKKLPVVKSDQDDTLIGMYTWNDVRKDQRKRDLFSLDCEGRFAVGAAIGLSPSDLSRALLLAAHGCKLIILDCSHGGALAAKSQLYLLRANLPSSVQIIVGNIASYETALFLLDPNFTLDSFDSFDAYIETNYTSEQVANFKDWRKDSVNNRPDALKVGIGPGSICTTRVVTGHGVPQLTAIYEVWRAIKDYGKRTGYYIPIIADGGIRSSGDIIKAFSVGASAVMLGSVFAATYESPGNIIIKGGKTFKTIRGMGSRRAMQERDGSRSRYLQEQEKEKQKQTQSTTTNATTTTTTTAATTTATSTTPQSQEDQIKQREQKEQQQNLTTQQSRKLVPEGVEGLVQLKGSVESVMISLTGGIQSGMAHSGARNINEFQRRARPWLQSFAGITEGKPHDIVDITE
eukprot:TRINITY_DN1264_c0_g3_i1.p1 TRINITY_DN1264_c0_g3~~TRINITY_DN1264_c0_g3_i1.p1  ORF type:complete len:612 (+),score=326.79 TRINITY_DN1264_c0_g3_i1:101-1936(+)